MRSLLLVEDDETMAVALRDGLSDEGWNVAVASDGVEGARLALQLSPEVIILDVMLPRLSGFDLCKQIRERGDRVPIIMLTARGQELDRVKGLRLGADDYVTKPFSFLELLARVEAVLRRSERRGLHHYRFGDTMIDFDRRELRRAGAAVELSAREWSLLRFFVEHRGEVLSREQLLEAVWNGRGFGPTRTVDVHVARLRKKLEVDPQTPAHFMTLHRVGYKFTGDGE